MKRRAPIRHRAPLFLVAAAVGLGLAVRLPHLSTGSIDFDEGVYWLSMRSMRAGNALFTAVYSSQPPAFLLLTEPPWSWLGGSIVAARAVMLAWGVVAVGAGGVLGWRLGGRVAGVATAVLLTADPRMVDQSLTLQADGPATSLALLSLAAGAVAVTVKQRRWSAAAALCGGAFMTLGVLTKLFDVGVVPSLVVLLLSSRRRWPLLGLSAAGGLLVAGGVLLPLVAAWGAMWSQAVGLHVATRSLYPGISIDYLALFLHREWPLAVLAGVGMIMGWRHSGRAWAVGVVWIAGAVAALVATRPVFQHHTVLLIPGLAVLAATAVAEFVAVLAARLGRGARLLAWTASCAAAALVSALLLQHALAALVFPAETALVARLRALVPPPSQVFGDDQFHQAMAGLDAPPQLIDTSGVRLSGSDITAPVLEAAVRDDPRVCAVLFGGGRLAGVPGLVAWTAVHYPVRTALPGGDVLYEKRACVP